MKSKEILPDNFDTLVIEFQKGGKSIISVALKKPDLETMINLHGHSIGDIVNEVVKDMKENEPK